MSPLPVVRYSCRLVSYMTYPNARTRIANSENSAGNASSTGTFAWVRMFVTVESAVRCLSAEIELAQMCLDLAEVTDSEMKAWHNTQKARCILDTVERYRFKLQLDGHQIALVARASELLKARFDAVQRTAKWTLPLRRSSGGPM